MATAKNQKPAEAETPEEATAPAEAEAPAGPPGGFTEESIELDGWYNPENSGVVHGQIVGTLTAPNMDGSRSDILLISLREPARAFQKDDTEGTILEKGQVIAVRVTHNLKPLLAYVANNGIVWFHSNGTKPLGKGKKVWKFKVFGRGRKAPFVRMDGGAPTTPDDGFGDEIPF